MGRFRELRVDPEWAYVDAYTLEYLYLCVFDEFMACGRIRQNDERHVTRVFVDEFVGDVSRLIR
ncbi:MAG: hypothetical protein IRZ03_18885 [Acidobacterium ailaaui]|nr:hypothetical protein [Pseudacidobacterium ailaaui]